MTYRELDIEVSRLAAAMAAAGIKKGDVVGIYLPMVPVGRFKKKLSQGWRLLPVDLDGGGW